MTAGKKENTGVGKNMNKRGKGNKRKEKTGHNAFKLHFFTQSKRIINLENDRNAQYEPLSSTKKLILKGAESSQIQVEARTECW